MNEPANDPALNERPGKSRPNGTRILLYVLIAIVVTAAGTLIIVKTYLFPSEFKPVVLNTTEEVVLEQKLERLDAFSAKENRARSGQTPATPKGPEYDRDGNLIPEKYSEEGASREISFTERELNALLAKNTDLASRMAIDLSDDLVSAKILVPVDEDFPVLGGQVLKVRAGLEVAYSQGKPIVVLRGVSVMGVPVPGAWLGGMKNIDLVKEYGAREGFWSAFAAGVENIKVEEGALNIKLKE